MSARDGGGNDSRYILITPQERLRERGGKKIRTSERLLLRSLCQLRRGSRRVMDKRRGRIDNNNWRKEKRDGPERSLFRM